MILRRCMKLLAQNRIEIELGFVKMAENKWAFLYRVMKFGVELFAKSLTRLGWLRSQKCRQELGNLRLQRAELCAICAVATSKPQTVPSRRFEEYFQAAYKITTQGRQPYTVFNPETELSFVERYHLTQGK